MHKIIGFIALWIVLAPPTPVAAASLPKCVLNLVRLMEKTFKNKQGAPRFNALIPELHVSDLEISRHFYEDILGFRILYSRRDLHFLEKEGAQIMITTDGYLAADLEAPFGRGISFEIEVKALEPVLGSLQAESYPLWREPHFCEYECAGEKVKGLQFLVQDPDGYLLRFSTTAGSVI